MLLCAIDSARSPCVLFIASRFTHYETFRIEISRCVRYDSYRNVRYRKMKNMLVGHWQPRFSMQKIDGWRNTDLQTLIVCESRTLGRARFELGICSHSSTQMIYIVTRHLQGSNDRDLRASRVRSVKTTVSGFLGTITLSFRKASSIGLIPVPQSVWVRSYCVCALVAYEFITI